GFDHPVTTIGYGHSDCAAAESFHQWAGAIGDARHLVGFILDGGDIAVEAIAHDVFEREGLHDANALQCFLHRFEDLGAAVKLRSRDRIDASDHFAQNQECGRGDYEAQE